MEEKQSMTPLLKQLHISLTIVAISLCTGLIETRRVYQVPRIADAEEAQNVAKELVEWRNLCQDTVPFVGVILLTVIAEFVGRKAAFGVIILLTMTASSLSIPETKLCLQLVHIAAAMSSGGQIILFYIFIAEYCEPKYRLVFSIANVTVYRIGCIIVNLVYVHLDKVDIAHYVQYFEIFVAIVCVGSLLQWPESPYWLALKGREAQSLNSFLVLRCDSAAAEMELKAPLESRDRLDSFKLFFLPLLITIVLFSTFWCSVLTTFWLPLNGEYYHYLVAMECVLIFVLRKGTFFYYEYGSLSIVLALIVSGTLQYGFTIFFFYALLSGGDISGALNLFGIIRLPLMTPTVFLTCYKLVIIFGPTNFSMSKFAECIPFKRRSLLMCVSGICFFLIRRAIVFVALFAESKFGRHVLLLILTKMSLLGLAFLAFFLVPKTEGKTLTEVETTLYLPKHRQTAPSDGS